MRIRINEIKLVPDHTAAELEQEIRRLLRLKQQPFRYEIMRRSIDARKKPELYYVYTVDVEISHPKEILRHNKNNRISLVEKKQYQFPFHSMVSRFPPVVVGSGPAGLFCALMLARAGLHPVVLERGEAVEQRMERVKQFWEGGRLDPDSNVQFGEGGAGTFSDGKLNTLIKDPQGKIRYVLQEFVNAGADPSILYDHKPHIGTDVLVRVVRHIREEILSLGGTFRFRTCLTGILEKTDASLQENIYEESSQKHPKQIRAPHGEKQEKEHQQESRLEFAAQTARYRLILNGTEVLDTDHLVLAIGHSARDTFEMLLHQGFSLQPKAFAVGLRVEHPQQLIDDSMYGKNCPYSLGAAPYKLTHKCRDGRGVYSFCMCPGGYVVNASSEEGSLAVNGMSYSDRNSGTANSAIVVTVSPEDYKNDTVPIHPLAGVEFQRELENRAYRLGDGKIPVQRYGDFAAVHDLPVSNNEESSYGCAACEEQPGGSDDLDSQKSGRIPDSFQPKMRGEYKQADVRQILPESINKAILEGMEAFGRKIPGFDDRNAWISGVESRTSSPVRIPRDDTCQSTTHPAIYPCGEGAGYAGGITSAAIDGIRISEALCNSLMQEEN